MMNNEKDDWDIEYDEENEALKLSFSSEEAKKELLYWLGDIGGISKEETDTLIKKFEEEK